MIKLIGFRGKARSGKDTCAISTAAFLEDIRVNLSYYAFADPLKDFVMEITGFKYAHVYGDMKEIETDVTIDMHSVKTAIKRTFSGHYEAGQLVNLTKAFKRVIQEEFYSTDNWIACRHTFTTSPRRLLQVVGTEFARECIKDSIWIDLAQDELNERKDVMIISDVRFDNEAQWCRENGLLFDVVRDTSSYNVYSNHASENISMQNVPATDIIYNDSDLDALRDEIYEKILSYFDYEA